MGWVSTLEDIIERFNSSIQEVRAEVEARHGADPPVEQRNTFLVLLSRAEAGLAGLMQNLDLATDPEVRLAAEVIELERRKKDLTYAKEAAEIELKSLRAERTELLAQVRELEGAIARLKREVRSLHRERRERAEKVDEAMKKDPEGYYDVYSDPEELKRLYPEDDPRQGE